MMNLYHTSNKILVDGTELKSRYGNMLQDKRYFKYSYHNYMQYIKEMIFEDTRKGHFPNAPSRLNCLYLFKGIEIAKVYANEQNKKYITEVTIISSGRILTADMTWLNIANQRQSYDELKEIAHRYFNGEKSNSPLWETLFDGEVQVYNCFEV